MHVSVNRGNNANIPHYSVDLRIKTYTEPVPLKYRKLATKFRGYTDIFTAYRGRSNYIASRTVRRTDGRRNAICITALLRDRTRVNDRTRDIDIILRPYDARYEL